MSEISDLGQIDEVLSPCCDEEIKVSEIGKKLKCPLCNVNLKQFRYCKSQKPHDIKQIYDLIEEVRLKTKYLCIK